MIAAWRQNSTLDTALVAFATIGLSVPSFWLGLLLLLYFGLDLRWFPIVGYVAVEEDALRGLKYLILPAATVVIHDIGLILRMVRASALEIQSLDYIAHARAKGLKESTVLWRHALPNALGPAWTMVGLLAGSLLVGMAIVESIFTIPGIGRLLVEAIYSRDYTVIQGVMILIAFCYVIINLIIDLLSPLFDPRVVAE
jgi:peptide/nickel transport system permease protein